MKQIKSWNPYVGMPSFTLSPSLKRSASLGDQRPLSRTSCATCGDIALHSCHSSGVSVKFFETMTAEARTLRRFVSLQAPSKDSEVSG